MGNPPSLTEDADAARGALLLALRGAGIRDLAILRAIETVPREDFVPPHLRSLSARNLAVPIACGQTMAPPVSLALMLDALGIRPTDRVLEIGTGSGYATAVLARLAREVVSFERMRTLATAAQERLRTFCVPARVVLGDGLAFPAQFGRFERIVVHLALTSVPRSLGEALADEGRIVAGVPADGDHPASLAAFERAGETFVCRRLSPMRFGVAGRDIAAVL